MKEIKKVVIPVGGFGTRLLPITKSQPKEMLPIVDKPAVQYVVEEAINSGINDILLITGRGKRAIEDYFDYAIELEQELEQKGKHDLLKIVRETSELASIFYVRQKLARGLGDAVYHAKGFINDEYFGVLLADDIIDADVPVLKQMIQIHKKYGGNVIAVMKVPMSDVKSYGIIEAKKIENRVYEVKDLVEKPEPIEAPSNLAIVGRYILNHTIFEALEKTQPGKNGEIQLTDAIRKLLLNERVFAYEFEGTRYDVGEKLGLIKANIAFSFKREELKEELKNYLKDLCKED
ncbi:MAG: UTP--glucose-1-phosphate uridylyltransferase [Caldisericum exile]|uniref:UTP--glucose-1-phosphate uridylyltransferase n=1 Tax=Caldisericum exile TaxID=693075 RepID=A0A2J6X5V4_9BACT|nr:MAG: UTP--glucose-1-phosphate uridylyltransferase [Caldisericum exile]